jgi:hypothetical protein
VWASGGPASAPSGGGRCDIQAFSHGTTRRNNPVLSNTVLSTTNAVN